MFRHGLFDMEDDFDDVSYILVSSLACGSFPTFYLFKNDIKQEYDQPKEDE
tara:strand:+ start:136 stop:288 length:153 start_codon:yes stop_codon:yes gene_type:complete